jgi:CubicO group peptidase (beta-lactamase class C family)
LVASASKILSAGVIMRLQDQGALDIAQPIDRYLGAWGEHKANVTLAQLMSGSSGLPSADEVFAAAEMPNVPQRYAAHVCEVKTQPSLTACGKAIYQDDVPENNQKPDTEFRYGGSAWQLAGAIAEVVSGKSWAELVDETYAKPCELDSLGYTNQGEITRKRYTYPPDVDGDVSKLPITDNPLIEGGAYSTASDYAQVLLMHLRGGKCGSARVLSEKSVETMQADRVAAYGGKVTTDPTNPFTGYGLGWWTTDSFIADPGAYGAFPLIDLNNDFAVVLLLEAKSSTGPAIMRQVQPILVEIMAEQKS